MPDSALEPGLMHTSIHVSSPVALLTYQQSASVISLREYANLHMCKAESLCVCSVYLVCTQSGSHITGCHGTESLCSQSVVVPCCTAAGRWTRAACGKALSGTSSRRSMRSPERRCPPSAQAPARRLRDRGRTGRVRGGGGSKTAGTTAAQDSILRQPVSALGRSHMSALQLVA